VVRACVENSTSHVDIAGEPEVSIASSTRRFILIVYGGYTKRLM